MIEKTINAVARDRWFWLWFYASLSLSSAPVWLSVAGVWGHVLFFSGAALLAGTFIWFGRKHWKAVRK